jgi:hypothetical protein
VAPRACAPVPGRGRAFSVAGTAGLTPAPRYAVNERPLSRGAGVTSMQGTGVHELLAEERAARRALESRLRALSDAEWAAPLLPGGRSAHDVVIGIAARLSEAGARVPARLAGAPPRAYDAAALTAAALTVAADWTPREAFGALRRAADRFEVIASELTDDILVEEPDVRAWLASAARVMITEHLEGPSACRRR